MNPIQANMQGKTCLVTGATSGIGRETAMGLARMGARVLMVARNKPKGEQTVTAIRAATGNHAVELLVADLSSQREVRRLAAEVLERAPRLDLLVNNAGLILKERSLTSDGLEHTFALNHLGYFLLTNLLLDRLKESAPARIVNVASEAQRIGRIDFDDLMGERRYSSWRAYGQSKLANIIFTYELARRLQGTGVTVNALHPGGVATGFGVNNKGIMGAIMQVVRPFMLTAEQGADTVLYLAASPEVAGMTGQYWAKRKPIRSNAQSYDEAIAQRLWQVSAELTGLND